MSNAEFDAITTRLKRILNRCGWSVHLRLKPSGWYAGAAKRDREGKRHWKYIAPLYRVENMPTGKIQAILPDDI
jgi:hypothetical protein